MQKSLLISGFGHFSILFVMIFYGWDLNTNIDPLPKPVKVSIISTSEFDAKLSAPPNLIVKKLAAEIQLDEKVSLVQKIDIENSLPISINNVDKIDLQVEDTGFVSKTEIDSVEFNNNLIVLDQPKKIELPKITNLKQIEGNEQRSYESPVIRKPKPRTADRIDKVAISKSSSDKILETPKKAIKADVNALETSEISEAEAPKEASTKITPEGKKDVPIEISGAVKRSLPPPSRPKVKKQAETPPIKRPRVSTLLKRKKEIDQIEMLLSQIELSTEQVAPEVSIMEKNNMMAAIAQKLAKYWEQGILAGNSNFEKYIVQVEVEVNSLGEIIGGVKPLVPKVPKGRYLIAFRQASNALISAATLPIVPGKYPSGITFEITFDPEEGFSF